MALPSPRRIWGWLTRWLTRPQPTAPAAPSVVVPIARARAPRVRREPRADDPHDEARWEFRRDILDRLDEFFDCLQQVRRHDPHGWVLFGRAGLMIPGGWIVQELPAARPAFGGILIKTPREEEPKCIYPSFVYFEKLRAPGWVQQAPGVVYRLTCVWDSRRHDRDVALCRCHCVITSDGCIHLLKERKSKWDQAQLGKQRTWVRQTGWDFPRWTYEFLADNPERKISLVDLLKLALGTWASAHARVVIRVKRGLLAAGFGIELKRCPRFFSDRDRTRLAVDGKRKRIFHSVVEHVRDLHTKQVTVRAHYRGIRHFDWNSYGVVIVQPQGYDLRTLTATAEYRSEGGPGLVPMGRLGKQVAHALDT